MSTTYHTVLLHGYEAAWKARTEPVTKYREDTGEPYQKERTVGWILMVGDVEIISVDEKYDVDETSVMGCEVLREQNDILYIGIKMAEVEPWEVKEVGPSDDGKLAALRALVGKPPGYHLISYTD